MPNEKPKISFHSFIHSFILVITTLTVIITFTYCSEKQSPEPTSLQKSETKLQKSNNSSITNPLIRTDSIKGIKKDSLKLGGGIIIQPNAASYCYKTVEYWILEKYLPVDEKKLGIWIKNSYWDSYWLERLKNYFGFSLLLVQWPDPPNDNYNSMVAKINIAESVGWNRYINMMHCIPGKNYFWITYDVLKDFKYHYTDEPFEHDPIWTINELISASQLIYNQNPNSKLFVGCADNDYTIDKTILARYSYFINSTTNSRMMYTDYENGPFNNIEDQSGCWTYFDDYFGSSRITSQWIGLDEDYHGLGNIEYGRLLEVASEHGYNEMWLYGGSSDNVDRIETFCGYAYQKNWLNRFERRWIFHYRCMNQNPCNCDPNSTDNWILEDSYPTYETRIISN